MKLLVSLTLFVVLSVTSASAATTTNPDPIPLIDGLIALNLQRPLSNPAKRTNIGPPFSMVHEGLIEYKITLHLNGRTGVKARVKINFDFQMRNNLSGYTNHSGGSFELPELNDTNLTIDDFRNAAPTISLEPNTPQDGTSYTSLLVASASLVSSTPLGISVSVGTKPGAPSDRANWTLLSP